MPKDALSRHGAADAVLDVSRGVIFVAGDTGMSEHVAACPECRQKVNAWKRFAGVTQRLREVEPPAEVVGKAKAIAVEHPRVTGVTTLEVAYQAEQYTVDLRISREGSRKVVILGQISNVQRRAKRVADVAVTLLAGDRAVARAFSNARGEFHLEHAERDPMWIEVAPEEGRIIRIPLRPRQMTS